MPQIAFSAAVSSFPISVWPNTPASTPYIAFGTADAANACAFSANGSGKDCILVILIIASCIRCFMRVPVRAEFASIIVAPKHRMTPFMGTSRPCRWIVCGGSGPTCKWADLGGLTACPVFVNHSSVTKVHCYIRSELGATMYVSSA